MAVQTPKRGEAASEKYGAPRAAVVEPRSGQTRAGLTAPEVIALGLVGLLALVGLGSVVLVLGFI